MQCYDPIASAKEEVLTWTCFSFISYSLRKMALFVIVGTGDCAHGLACFFQNHNDATSGNILQVTKPKLVLDEKKDHLFHDTGVQLVPFDEALKASDVVILTIPASALRIFVPEYYSLLKDKVLVDATNSSRKGEDLRELLCVTDVKWVKAFNDIGAIDGLTDKVTTKHKVPAKICSPNTQALQIVKDFAEKSLGFDVKVVPYERYADVAANQDSLGTEWLIAGWYMGISFVLFQIYNILRHHLGKGYPWYSLPLFTTNKALAWTVLHGMTSAQIPGM
jgi:predicted dinucleotide-binding enzyme